MTGLRSTSPELLFEAGDRAPDATWDAFAAASPDGWFWHSRDWLNYNREYAANRFAADLSFTIHDAQGLAAICPVFLERGTPFAPDQSQFGIGGGPIAVPALAPRLDDAQGRRILDAYVEHLGRLAEEHDVAYARLRVPAVSPSNLAGRGGRHPLERHGFIPLPFQTQTIDLRAGEDELWKGLRKGHRSDVKTAAKSCRFTLWDKGSITAAKFHEYQDLHAKDAGRVTRSPRTFDLMREWIEHGHGFLAEAQYADRPVAFALIVAFAKGAYYGSACKDPDQPRIPAQHFLQWHTLLDLKARGFEAYDVGLQQTGPTWFDQPSPKEISISQFKRGFGGTTRLLPTFEFHYRPQHMTLAFQQRLEAWDHARGPDHG